MIGGEQEDVLPDASHALLDDTEQADEDEGEDNTTSVPASAKRESPVEEPYDFDRCTIQIGLQLLPDDGDPAGPVAPSWSAFAITPTLSSLR